MATKWPKVKNSPLKTYQPSYRHCTSKSPFTRLHKNVINNKRSLKNISIIFHMILLKSTSTLLRRGHTSFTSQLNFWSVPPCFCELLLLPMTHMMLHSDQKYFSLFSKKYFTDFCNDLVFRKLFTMAIQVVEFSSKGYKIRKVFG